MKDYVKEMIDAWTREGEQAAYDLCTELLQGIQADRERLDVQANAVRAMGEALRRREGVRVTREPASPVVGLRKVEPSERSKVIVQTARDVLNLKQEMSVNPADHAFTSQEVLRAIRQKGLDLGVKQPYAVIGTVLAKTDGFRHSSKNVFEPLPW